MALQIIAKGKVWAKRTNANPHGWYYCIEEDGEQFVLGMWAKFYVGKTLVISLEEEEKELEPIVSARLKRLFATA